MGKVTLNYPIIGQKDSTEEPKVTAALKVLEEWANGKVGTENIEAGTVTEAMLTAAVQAKLGGTVFGLTKKEAKETSVTGVSGELIVFTGNGSYTLTLPSPAVANRTLGVVNFLNANGEVTVTTPSGKVMGEYVESASCKLALHQALLVESDGTNYYILGGSPKREGKYTTKSYLKEELEPPGAGVEVSATRDALISLKSGTLVGVESIGGVASPKVTTSSQIRVPAGQKWKNTTVSSETVEIYVLLV